MYLPVKSHPLKIIKQIRLYQLAWFLTLLKKVKCVSSERPGKQMNVKMKT